MNIKDIMEKAMCTSQKSQCLQNKSGAILYDTISESIVGRGFQGAKVICQQCKKKSEVWDNDECWSIHAPIRAILDYFNIYKLDYNLSHLIMFVTQSPCDQCLKYMDLMNIKTVYYQGYKKNNLQKWKEKIKIIKVIKENEVFYESVI